MILVGITAVALGLAVASRPGLPAAPRPDFRQALVVNHRPVSLNPLINPDDAGVRTLSSLLYRHLLRLDDRALPVPDLATGLSASPDGLSYELPLRAGLRWSDGQPITVDDVIATLAFIQSPRYPTHTVAMAWKTVTLTSVPGAAVFHLPSPRASFAVSLTELPVLPLGKATPARIGVALAGGQLPTSGAYTVAGTTPTTLELIRNPQSHPAAQLQRLELKLVSSFDEAAGNLRSGGVDGVVATTPGERAQLLRQGHVTPHDLTSFRFVDLLFNERTPGLDSSDVRHAVAAAVDRARLIVGPLAGLAVGQAGPIPAGIVWANPAPEVPGPDPSTGAAALDKGGWLAGADGVRVRNGTALRFSLDVPDADPLPAVGREVVAQLGGIGISASINVVPTATYLSGVIAPHLFQLAIADWDNGADPDVSGFWRSSAVPPQGLNVSGAVDDPFLDRDLDDLATVTDVGQRRAAAARVNTLLNENAPAVFLYAPKVSLVVSNAFTRLSTPPVGDPFANVASWRR